MEPPSQPPPSEQDHVAVFDGPIDLQRLVAAVGDPGAGAIATFLGVTRDNFQGARVLIGIGREEGRSIWLPLTMCIPPKPPGKTVVRLEYEGYVPMAERVMRSICAQVGRQVGIMEMTMHHT